MSTIDYNIIFGGSEDADANIWGGQDITMEGNSAAAYGAGGGMLTVTGSVSPVSITVTGGTMVIDGGFVSTSLVTLNNATFDMSSAGGVSGTHFDFGTGMSDVDLPPNGSQNFNNISFTNFSQDDAIHLSNHDDITNLNYDGDSNTLSFDQDGQHFSLNVDVADGDAGDFHVEGNEIIDGVCYARGTRIRTIRGDVAVEALKVGDMALNTSDEARPIIWLGRRTWRRGSAPRSCWPVRIAADAFGAGKPSRDVIVSPAHGICVNVVEEVFIQAGALVNGATIAHVDTDEIEYWHIELESHDVLVAEGLPAESYLECGNRAWFSGESVVSDPDRAAEFHARAARPYIATGPEVDAARARLRVRAEALGWHQTNDMDPHLLIDGKRTEPSVDGGRACFLVPASAHHAVLVTQTFCPADQGREDHRELGVSLGGIRVRDGFGLDCTITLDHPAFTNAFHPEDTRDHSPSRWTRARLPLPAELWSGSRGPILLTLTFDPAASRRWIAPEAEAEDTNVVPLRATG